MDFTTSAGRQILVVVDHYSSSTWVFVLPIAKSRLLVGALRDIFRMSGAPDVIWLDNGPHFSSSWLPLVGMSHRTSSAHYPQSNSHAEAAVKSMKRLFSRCCGFPGAQLNKDQWRKGILRYRNTPTKPGPSPAQILFCQPVQNMVPAHHRAFKPEYQKAADTSDTFPSDVEAVARYDSSANSLPSFQIGTPVLVQNDKSQL